jgi:hypothetical protein
MWRLEKAIPHKIERRDADRIGHMLQNDCFLKHIVEGEREGGLEVAGTQVRRHTQLLEDLKLTRKYWELKEGALDKHLTVLCGELFLDEATDQS